MQTKRELWRPIPRHEGFYEVSNLGRIRSLDRRVERFDRRRHDPVLVPVPGKVLTPTPMKSGHLFVSLGLRERGLLHRFILEAFVGPCPEGMEACHLNDDPTDNRVENLRWDTRSENMRDRTKNGKHHQARKTHCVHGHEFTVENTYLQHGSNRACRTCRAASSRQRKAAARAAARIAQEQKQP